jgi:hypothetical protein
MILVEELMSCGFIQFVEQVSEGFMNTVCCAGVQDVLCDQWSRKVTVVGNMKVENVLKRVQQVKKGSELWQQ